MSDDPVTRLEQLAALHSKGDLTDAEFARMKASVLDADGASTSASESAPAPATFQSITSSPGLRLRVSQSRGGWGQGSLLAAAVFLGFMYAVVGPAVVHSSALWTGNVLCASGSHLAANVTSYSYGPRSGTQVAYACVQGKVVKQASTIEIIGLMWLVGSVIAYVAIQAIAGIRRLARAG
jgi:hypothetical protein